MAIIATTTPAENSLAAAYRPILILAIDDGTTGLPPMVYCDVYFDGNYYKTISANVPSGTFFTSTVWTFDISGLAQEYIKTMTYDITTTDMHQVYGSSYKFGMAYTMCKIRTSAADAYGVITPGGPVPVQATYGHPSIPGGGFSTVNAWYTVNASLQLQDNQRLENMLLNFRISGAFDTSGTFTVNPANKVYQLSYKTDDYMYFNDWGQIPIITVAPAFNGISTAAMSMILIGYNSAGTVIWLSTTPSVMSSSGCIYTLPTGIRQWVAMFPSLASVAPSIKTYRVGLYNPANFPALAYITPPITLKQRDGISPGMTSAIPSQNAIIPKHTRIWFRNYLGQLDYINFIEREEKLQVTSAQWERPVTNVPDGYDSTNIMWYRSQQSRGRMNVHSSEVSTATAQFTENQIPFLKQLFATTLAFLEFTSPDLSYGSPEPAQILVPIVIVDGSIQTLSYTDRYEYRVSMQYIPSNENIIVR